MTKSITATILEYLRNKESMIFTNPSNSGMEEDKRKKNYDNKRFASHEFWIRMGGEL
jgi:hypothetical protein